MNLKLGDRGRERSYSRFNTLRHEVIGKRATSNRPLSVIGTMTIIIM